MQVIQESKVRAQIPRYFHAIYHNLLMCPQHQKSDYRTASRKGEKTKDSHFDLYHKWFT